MQYFYLRLHVRSSRARTLGRQVTLRYAYQSRSKQAAEVRNEEVPTNVSVLLAQPYAAHSCSHEQLDAMTSMPYQ